MMKQARDRERWIDYIKAVACLSVLTFHVIYGLQNAGLPCGGLLSGLKLLCGIFQIPAFMFASGYLFGRKSMGNYFYFQGRKIVNLGVPYIVFSIAYYVINVTFSSSVNFSYTPKDLLKIYIIPIAQYWYLLATMLIFLFLPILEKLIKNEFMVLALLVTWKIVNTYRLSLTNYDYYFAQYAMYFYLGTLYCRHHDKLSLKKEKVQNSLVILLGFIALFVSLYQFEWGEMYSIIEFFMAVLSIYLLICFFEGREDKQKNPFLDIIAKYSFQIYLLHTMVTAAVRILLCKMGIVSQIPQFVLGWGLGLGITLFVAWVCEKTIVLNIFFFPERTIRKLRNRKKVCKE